MSLPELILDDVNWTDLVERARTRIAPASRGQWTHHAPVDPGVTLLELFAWLLEQRVYWLDQVPDSLVRAALSLLGERVRPARAAATVLWIEHASDPAQAYARVPAGTAFERVSLEEPLVFTTTSSVTLLPVARVQVQVDGVDCSGELEQQREFNLLPAHGERASARIELCLRQPLPRPRPGPPLALCFELDTRVVAQWHSDAVDCVPPPATIVWSYSRGSNQRGTIARKDVDDGTGGLRRSGVVRLAIPDDWEPLPSDSSSVHRYALWIETEHATFTYPPRLRRLRANAVVARHRITVRAWHAKEWLPLPGNVLELSSDKPLPMSVRLMLKEFDDNDGTWRRWKSVDDLAFCGPADRVFVVDRTARTLRFGDGLNGRIPRLVPVKANDHNVKLAYLAGGGAAGNVGDSLPWRGVHHDHFRACNLVAAAGGRDPESIAEARGRMSTALRQPTRAVTRHDYRDLAKSTKGIVIARAHAAIGEHPRFPCIPVPGAVTLFAVPHAPRDDDESERCGSSFVAAPRPDPGALAHLSQEMDSRRLVGTELFIRAPFYRNVSVVVEIAAEPVDPTVLRLRITKRLERFLDPLTGGEAGDGWPFGEPLRPSELLRVAQSELGDDGTVERVLIGLDGEDAKESCADVPIRPHELVAVRDLVIRMRRPARTSGGLQ